MSDERDRVRLSLDVSPSLNNLLDDLAARTGATKSDVLRKAILVMDAAVSAHEDGKALLTVPEDVPLDNYAGVTRIEGLLAPRSPSNRRQYPWGRREGQTGEVPPNS